MTTLAVSPPRHVGLGVWRLADPKISLASISSMFLAFCAAARDGPIAWEWLALTVVGILCLEAAKNASGEIFDFDSGADLAIAEADRSPFSGGKRVIVDGLLTRRETAAVAAVGYALGIAAGLAIAILREPRVLWVGMVGVACAYFYHAPPLKLAYRGFGELAVGLCYGPLIGIGAYLVQRNHLPNPLLFVPLGLSIAAFLWINEVPDCAADLSAGKRNLVARLGRRRARWGYLGLQLGVVVSLALLPRALWLGGVSCLPAALSSRIVLAHWNRTALLIRGQALSLLSFVLLAVGSGIGLLLR